MFDTDVGSHVVSHGECACADWPRSARVNTTHACSISPVEIPCSMITDSRVTHVCDNCEIISQTRIALVKLRTKQLVGKTINVFWARLVAQLTICAQKWRNFVCSSTVSLRFVLSRVFFIFLYNLGPSSLVTAICHSCLDIVLLQVKLSALKSIGNKLPCPKCRWEFFFNYGLRNIFYWINDTIRIMIHIVYRINVSTIRIETMYRRYVSYHWYDHHRHVPSSWRMLAVMTLHCFRSWYDTQD